MNDVNENLNGPWFIYIFIVHGTGAFDTYSGASLSNDPHNSSRHARRERAGNESTHAKIYNFVTPFRREATESANQDPEAGQIRETRQGVRHDEAASRIESAQRKFGHIEKGE